MGNFKYIPALAILATLLSGMANAQPPLEWERAPLRNEFVSYSQREIATAGDRTSERHFMPLTDFTMERDSLGNAYYTTVAEIPFLWLDREIFLHT